MLQTIIFLKTWYFETHYMCLICLPSKRPSGRFASDLLCPYWREESRSLSLEYTLPSGWAQCARRRKVGMQMCGTWSLAETELVLSCSKADLYRHNLLQGRKGAEALGGLLCRTHCSWILWQLCFECIEIFIHGLLVSWQSYLRLIDPSDICLCVLVLPIQRVYTGERFPGVPQIRNPDLRWLVA